MKSVVCNRAKSAIWFYSLMWEHGKDKEPVAFLDERGIVK